MTLVNEFKLEELTMNDYVLQFLDKYKDKSQETMITYKNTLEMMAPRVFGKTLYEITKSDLEQLTYEVIERYKKVLMIGNSNTTVNNRISAIKSFITFLTARNAIQYDISKLSLVETLNDDSEITEMIPEDTLYDYVDFFEHQEARKGLEKKWATLLMLETGNRAQEVLGLKKNQFVQDGDSYILKSKGKNKGKGNAEYFERIGVEIYEELMNLNPDSEKVFTISYDMLVNAFNRANEYFGNRLIKYTPHSVKHLAVTLEYQYTGCILTAQQKGKHKNIETTRRYLRINNVVNNGAFTRKLMNEGELYKEASVEELINVIDSLPSNMQQLINERLKRKL